MGNQAIVFLEPVNHVYKVMMAAADMGYTVIVMHVMKLHAPPPYERSLMHIGLDLPITHWFDEAALLQHLQDKTGDYELCGTYTGAEIALRFESTLRQFLGLTGHPRDRVDQLLNKYWVRQRLYQTGLSQLKSYNRTEIAALTRWPFAGAGVFKPCNGGASALVRRCHDLAELQQLTQAWTDKAEVTNDLLRQYIESSDEYFLDQCAEGELLSAESLVYRGEVIHLGLLSRTLLERDPTIEMGACFPHQHPLRAEIAAKVAAIHRALDIQYGATHVELMISPAGDIELIEFNLRFAGADALEIISIAYQRNVAQDIVRLCCDERPQIGSDQPAQVASMQYLLAPDNVQQLESIDFPPAVDFTRLHLPLGAKLGANRNQIDWVGCFIISAANYPEIVARVKQVRQQLKINDIAAGDDVNNRVIVC